MTRRMSASILAAACGLAATAPGAGAATMFMDGTIAVYQAAPGESNRLASSATGAVTRATFNDAGSYPLTRGAGCTAGSTPRRTICAASGGRAVRAIRIRLDDRSERVNGFYARSRRLRVTVESGSGGGRIVIRNASVANLIGGDGLDQLRAFSATGVANIRGAEGHDRLLGDVRRAVISGGAGNDRIASMHGVDVLVGNDGTDIISAGTGRDSVLGGLGDDTIQSGAGADVVNGNEGNDILAGGPDDDTVFGGIGRDRVDGQAGDDVVRGDDEIDTVVGGPGADSMYGGGGDDAVAAQDGQRDVVIDCGDGGLDLVQTDPFERDLITGCERL